MVCPSDGIGDRARHTAPAHVEEHHDLAAFDCGQPELNEWLRRQALKHEASGAVARSAATGKVRRQMPDPILVMIIGRLAVDARHQGHGLGYGLLRDALLRTLQVATQTGIRAVLLHAMTADATRFYQRAGFQESPVDPMTMMIAIADIEKALATAEP